MVGTKICPFQGAIKHAKVLGIAKVSISILGKMTISTIVILKQMNLHLSPISQITEVIGPSIGMKRRAHQVSLSILYGYIMYFKPRLKMT